MSIPFTVLDIQTALIAMLNADPDIQAIIVDNTNAFAPVLSDDPTTVSQVQNARLAVTLQAESTGDGTGGGSQGGKSESVFTFAVMTYLFDNQRDPVKKQQIIRMTAIVRQVLMHNALRTANGTLQQGQLWYGSFFRPVGGVVSSYFTTGGYRLSVTFLDIYSRMPFT